MSYKVIPVEKFKKEAKRLIKKYPPLKNELIELEQELMIDPHTGTPLGNGTYKIRIAIKSKSKGKSGGARVITYLFTDNKKIYLLTIYDKSEIDAVGDNTTSKIIDGIKKGNT